MSSAQRGRGGAQGRRCLNGRVRQERLGERLWVTRTPSANAAPLGVKNRRGSTRYGRRTWGRTWQERAVRAENREAVLGTSAQLDAALRVILGGPLAHPLSLTRCDVKGAVRMRRRRLLPVC